MCSLGIEPKTFALLTQCSTTEPQEHQEYTPGKTNCNVKKYASHKHFNNNKKSIFISVGCYIFLLVSGVINCSVHNELVGLWCDGLWSGCGEPLCARKSRATF